MNPSADESQAEPRGPFVQICASQNDLFALDADGNVYQYDFNATTWETLAADRSDGRPRRPHQPR